MALPQTVIYFSVNDLLKCRINQTFSAYGYPTDNSHLIGYLVPPLVGAVSRIFSVFTISPLELMRTKMQSKPMTLRAFYDTAKSTVVQVCCFLSKIASLLVTLLYLLFFFAGWTPKFVDWCWTNPTPRYSFLSNLLVHLRLQQKSVLPKSSLSIFLWRDTCKY